MASLIVVAVTRIRPTLAVSLQQYDAYHGGVYSSLLTLFLSLAVSMDDKVFAPLYPYKKATLYQAHIPGEGQVIGRSYLGVPPNHESEARTKIQELSSSSSTSTYALPTGNVEQSDRTSG
jgi:hypothetical protein